jgi:cytoskeletal protein CcmA (bactofilin family)
MATPFFGKRDEAQPSARPAAVNSYGGSSPSSAGAAKSAGDAAAFSSTIKEGGSRLMVGPNIKLKGVEITDCDTLMVEGLVEATMNSRVIQITEQGAFKGVAEVEQAEIRGEFDGSLTVRQKLMIYATGKVTGTIRYGKLVVEDGGQISGDITQAAPGASPKSALLDKSGAQAAA